MGRRNVLRSLILAGLSSAPLCPAQVITEDFEGGSLNGWTIYGDGTSLSWTAAGGNPGGCISAVDLNTGIPWGFVSNAAFAGDLSDFYGATLEWEVRTTHPGNVVASTPDLEIVGSTLTLVLDLPALSTTSWTARVAELTETAGWRKSTLGGAVPSQAEVLAVLSNVVAIRFRAEYSNSVDTGWIDNVVLTAACSLPADLDGNGTVDLDDLLVSLANLGTPSGATRADGDVDGDGDVDLDDLLVLLAGFGSSCP